MSKIPMNEHVIAQVNAAARSVGMSYGVYVALTGGAVPTPDWLVQRVSPKSRRCVRCGRAFAASSPRQIYCTPHCRKAAYDERSART